ncbi:hypothetical protein [Nocardioides alkalitolerans]|uniref:hypothetical protein n=1 Tax=Nocardioides alkalitolerans TaxID=281714 RepID=UPI0003FAAF8A|nr:hypothetical protein [Nocardioides alkalitolerans]
MVALLPDPEDVFAISTARRTTPADDDVAGVRFPTTDGSRSTTRTGIAVVADSLTGVDDALAQRVRASASWRKDYLGHLAASTAAAAAAPAARRIAEQGLASARERFVWVGADGDETPVAQRFGDHRPADDARRSTVTPEVVRGGRDRLTRVEVPYRGETLHGPRLVEQLDRWVEAGVVEPGFAAAVTTVVDDPSSLSLPGHEVVLLGAGAAMGPLATLMRWGAHVVALDVPTPRVQDRVRGLVAAGAGEAVLVGADLASDLDAVRPWLRQRREAEAVPVLGTHVYADGGRHVEVTVAADVLARDTLEERPEALLAYLNTPTDTFLVPPDAVRQARERAGQAGWNGRPHRLAHRVSGRRLFRPTYVEDLHGDDGEVWGLIDTLVDVQGPNYALAKRIQRWRATTAHQTGHRVSTTVAPASWTRSVTKNPVLAAAYAGAGRFGVEIFEPATVAPLLAAKLVADTLAPAGDPTSHPEALFSDTAAHGGLWRQPFEPRSALGVAALLGLPRTTLRRVTARRG